MGNFIPLQNTVRGNSDYLCNTVRGNSVRQHPDFDNHGLSQAHYFWGSSEVIHNTAEKLPPCIGIRIKNFNGLQVCCAIKASYSHELSIHHRQANLQDRNTASATETDLWENAEWFLDKSL